jgi:hypothetical protein
VASLELVLFDPALDTTREPLCSHWPSPELAERLSLLQRVRPGLPPAIVFHGMAGAMVPYVEAEAFRGAMVRNGNWCELVGFEGKGHDFSIMGATAGWLECVLFLALDLTTLPKEDKHPLKDAWTRTPHPLWREHTLIDTIPNLQIPFWTRLHQPRQFQQAFFYRPLLILYLPSR